MTLDELIENLEFGINRAEDDNWIAFSINAKDGVGLLMNLHIAKERLDVLDDIELNRDVESD